MAVAPKAWRNRALSREERESGSSARRSRATAQEQERHPRHPQAKKNIRDSLLACMRAESGLNLLKLRAD